MTAVKIGDVVAWADVPDGALVRDDCGDFCLRLRNRGLFVFTNEREKWLAAEELPDAAKWEWQWPEHEARQTVTIVALGLTGNESAADLRRLAEVFAVLGALRTEPGLPGFTRVYLGDMLVGGFSGGDGLTHWAGRLHAVGWRPGMSAVDAWHRLSTDGDQP